MQPAQLTPILLLYLLRLGCGAVAPVIARATPALTRLFGLFDELALRPLLRRCPELRGCVP
jgi:hypothetical protein